MAGACQMRLGGGLIALNQLKASGQLCTVLKHVGIVERCPVDALTPAQQRALDKKIMCEVYRCCESPQDNPRPNGEQYSGCVQQVFQSVDAFSGWKSRYKSEVSFLNGMPIMSEKEPLRPSAKGPFTLGSRRPDIVAVKDPTLPPMPGNIDAIYEFKFPGDEWGKEQRAAYRNIVGGQDKSVIEISDRTCPGGKDDEGRQGEGVLATASAVQLAHDNAEAAAVNDATAKIVSLWGAGRAAGWIQRLAEEASVLGKALGFAH